jgi:hypothetical protein
MLVLAAAAALAQDAADPEFLELLEFIGEFTTADGDWLDPEALLVDAETDGVVQTQDAGETENGQTTAGEN